MSNTLNPLNHGIGGTHSKDLILPQPFIPINPTRPEWYKREEKLPHDHPEYRGIANYYGHAEAFPFNPERPLPVEFYADKLNKFASLMVIACDLEESCVTLALIKNIRAANAYYIEKTKKDHNELIGELVAKHDEDVEKLEQDKKFLKIQCHKKMEQMMIKYEAKITNLVKTVTDQKNEISALRDQISKQEENAKNKTAGVSGNPETIGLEHLSIDTAPSTPSPPTVATTETKKSIKSFRI
ncbi:hypothetical protein CRE_08499 [Caenorhabditis remanei]|uniref:Uncharacterized protein n=1 Tax=Caenorhabditis remanei TaxID=31234 RepID=E3N6T3_CAERE|nr:hypothetical protein CRE_08499 [Caenorhabditis remanei]